MVEDNITLEREIFNFRTSNFIISKEIQEMINNHLFEIIAKEKDMNLLLS